MSHMRLGLRICTMGSEKNSSMDNGCQFCRLILEIMQRSGAPLDDASGIGIYHHGQWIQIAWVSEGTISSRVEVYDVPDLGPFATKQAIASNATAPLVQDIIGDTASGEAVQWI